MTPHRSFNPLPPPKRGETEFRRACASGQVFQSTPPAEARGDVAVGAAAWYFRDVSIHFPPPKRGETKLNGTQDVSKGVSIHSPRRSEGRRERLNYHTAYAEHDAVSIHSPRRSEGRPVEQVHETGT